jgi:hypothetical protein
MTACYQCRISGRNGDLLTYLSGARLDANNWHSHPDSYNWLRYFACVSHTRSMQFRAYVRGRRLSLCLWFELSPLPDATYDANFCTVDRNYNRLCPSVKFPNVHMFAVIVSNKLVDRHNNAALPMKWQLLRLHGKINDDNAACVGTLSRKFFGHLYGSIQWLIFLVIWLGGWQILILIYLTAICRYYSFRADNSRWDRSIIYDTGWRHSSKRRMDSADCVLRSESGTT